MPISASEFADKLMERRRPRYVKEFQVLIEQWLEAALDKDQSWCTIPLSHSPVPNDIILEAAAAFPEWEYEITDGGFDGRELQLSIPAHIKKAKGLN